MEVTGLRNPCVQLDRLQAGLMGEFVRREADGQAVRTAGVMAIVIAAGVVAPGDPIEAQLPAEPHRALEPV